MFLLASFALATSLAFGFLAIGRRLGRTAPLALVSLCGVAVAWIVGLAVMLNGWRDTDGWVDCYGYCHGWHWLGAL